jgi:hypothetical protein
MPYDLRMKRTVLLAGLVPFLIASAQEWHTLSGKIELLPGYIDHLKPGVLCYDSNCGQIWKPLGLEIGYELNNGSYELEEDNDLATFVYCQDYVNGQSVEFALEVDPEDKSQRLHISFPDEAIFSADVHSPADIRTMIAMTLTYRGKGYQKTKGVGSLLCGGLRDEVGNSFGNTQVQLTNLSTHARLVTLTDDGGHFTFSNLPSGRYSLESSAYKDELGCEYPVKSWRLRVRRQERILLYRRIVSISKRVGCRDPDYQEQD